jgi:peptidoglycan hydrolase-like protein with peptidoglycan-binding domain
MMTAWLYTNQYDSAIAERVPTVTLSYGSTGGCVGYLQQQINAWDGSSHALPAPLAVDGMFGPHTLNAVKAFQRSNAYCAGPVDGLAGPNTMSCLEFYVSGG